MAVVTLNVVRGDAESGASLEKFEVPFRDGMSLLDAIFGFGNIRTRPSRCVIPAGPRTPAKNARRLLTVNPDTCAAFAPSRTAKSRSSR